MTHAILAIDHLLQNIECGNKYAEKSSKAFLMRFREEMKKDEYLATYELLTRIAKIAKED